MSGRRSGRRHRAARAGASFGDVLLVLASLILLAALAVPVIRHRAAEAQRARVLDTVAALQRAAEDLRADEGTWPDTRPGEALDPALFAGEGGSERESPGRAGSERGAAGTAGEGEAAGPAYTWRRLEIVRMPEATSGEEAAATPDLEGVESPEPPPPPTPERFHQGALSVQSGDEALLGALLERYGSARSFVHDSVWTLVLPAVRVPLPSEATPAGGA